MATIKTDPKFLKFRQLFSKARSVVVLTGAGVSAESDVPTFRGDGGLWRQFNATDLATPSAFARSPSLVWEFYHYRRELVRTKQPNKVSLDRKCNLFTTRCTSCGFIEENNDSPICEALRNRGLPNESGTEIAIKDLPSCRQCQSLVRPHIVWFGESLWPGVMEKIDEELSRCDLFLVVR
ncbi:unnamed protein product [Rotaria sp. Silwood1]|nr:unnamed protein product [Rotaria sp. Silwood1]